MAYLHDIKGYDQENSYEGATVSLWFNGCPHKCVGCWNDETWERDLSLEIDNDEVVRKTLELLDKDFPKNLALLGGDPLGLMNLKDTIYILSEIKRERPTTKVVCWTGFRWEQIQNKTFSPVLPLLDILIDGRFDQEKRILGEKFGSSNQRVIDVKKSLSTNEIIQLESF